MPGQYARIPNPSDRHHQDLDDEVEAAFDYREDDDNEASESQPLNRNTSQPLPRAPEPPTNTPGTYNFEIVDYDYPPPGSPPPLSAHAIPNDWGNSNGMVPDFHGNPLPPPRQPWWKRAASVLPESVSTRLGMSSARPSGAVGGGINNDGVFANVTAKPTAPLRIQNGTFFSIPVHIRRCGGIYRRMYLYLFPGDESYVVPEDAQNEAPPSYASAQADAVPPYWETTIHAPFSPESMGEMIVDSLPTGSLFSFGWNLLVSVSFQFVGFLLTYLLHTSHAARFGSRAGLGITLIQFGFALRGKLDSLDGSDNHPSWTTDPWRPGYEAQPTSTSNPTYESNSGASTSMNTTASAIPIPDDGTRTMIADATAEWLSFFLMTIGTLSVFLKVVKPFSSKLSGWFVLLTSVLGFYRVKRWERSILSTQRESPVSAAATTAAPGDGQDYAIQGMSRIDVLRAGFGFRTRRDEATEEAQPLARAEEGRNSSERPRALDPNNPEHQELERERRFVSALRESGLL